MRSDVISGTLQRKKLSKQNLKSLQDFLNSSLSQPDIVLEWISRTPTMTDSDPVGPVAKKKKLAKDLSLVATTGGLKNSTSYAHSLHLLGIQDLEEVGIFPSVPDPTEECNLDTESKLVTAPSDLSSLSTYMEKWFLEVNPNEATLVVFLYTCLFLPKMDPSSVGKATIIFEFSGPFKSHNLHELVRGEQAIKFPLVKRDLFKKASNTLQTPAEVDLRSRSDFVFAALAEFYVQSIRKLTDSFSIPGISDNSYYCAVAIVAEVKATSSPRSFTAAKSQWSSLAYLQILERISIRREANYVGDENICQYGYLLCGLRIQVWKMGLQLTITDRRKSEILPKYFTFPVQLVGMYDLKFQRGLEEFIDLHKKLLRWWLGKYVPSYVKDLTDNEIVHPFAPAKWRISWQEAVAKCSPGENLQIEDFDITRLPEEQSVRPLGGPEDERISFQQEDTESDGEEPDGEEPDGEESDGEESDGGICHGITRKGTRCQNKIKIDKYCGKHYKKL
ncbi:hypothetical protein MMC31_003498 [Peltigera leucophlebia]|nr:hypothetical protein [Peltigera leucophlebia]